MDKLARIKALLERIRLSEGNQFEYDEQAIFKEYENQERNKSSLAIKILSILGGLLGTFTFLIFLVFSGLYDSEWSLLLFGIACVILAVWFQEVYKKTIIDTVSIAIYIIGIALFSFGLSKMNFEENHITIFIGLIAFCSLLITQGFILSFISVLVINGCLLFLITTNHIYDLIHLYVAVNTIIMVYLFLKEATLISLHKKVSQGYNSIRIGVVVSLLLGLVLVGKKHLIPVSPNYTWLSSIILILAVLYLVSIILKINDITSVKTKITVYVLTCLVLASIVFSPAILGAITIVLLSFLVNYKTGFVIGIISMIYFISQFYYDLNFTLLTKSIILITTGVVFLLFYVFMIKKVVSNEKV